MSQIVNTFGLSANSADGASASLDMFRRPVANVVFVVSQADTKSIIEGSLGGLVSQWKSQYGENRVHNMIQGAEANDKLYTIDSTKYSLLARSTDHSRVKNFLKQLELFESELDSTVSAQNAEPSLSIVVFTAMRDLNTEEAVEARQLLQNQYLPRIIQKLNDKTQERVISQVIYDEKLTNANAVGRKLMAAYNYAAVVSNTTKNATNTTVPTANEIAEWQAAVWTCIILIFAGIFAVKFIMSIDYSADQVNVIHILLTTFIDDLCSRTLQSLLKNVFVP
jgi:hypothetical protein